MSGFLSPDAEAALQGEEEEASRLFYRTQVENARLAGRASQTSYHQQYQQHLTSPNSIGMSSGQPQRHVQGFVSPTQYVSWPSNAYPALQPVDYSRAQYATSPTPIVPSSPYADQYSNAPWPQLHPDDKEGSSDTSRSVSPNPGDLHNFGILLSDGRTWRCAYPNCTSQAKFTRGCDLRKHFKRHTKHLFCRHEDCSQSREGGFSSRKDRDRHEQRHNPGVVCSHPGCERLFSRVDNMKDHVRRIHGQKT